MCQTWSVSFNKKRNQLQTQLRELGGVYLTECFSATSHYPGAELEPAGEGRAPCPDNFAEVSVV